MSGLSNESTPRERVARLLVLLRRIRLFWRSATAVMVIGLCGALTWALLSPRVYRSETSVLFHEGIQTQQSLAESPAQRAARLGPKLRDLVYARPELEEVVKEFHLFPEKSERSMLNAVEAMQAAIGFRARAGDSFVISFAYTDAKTAQRVTTRLAERMIDKYDRENIDSATLTRDFLHHKLAEAEAQAETASRALSVFLAEHPQFQWGVNDSPYAPAPNPGVPFANATPPGAATSHGKPLDTTLAALERDLARTEAELFPSKASNGFRGPASFPRRGPEA